MAEFRRTGSLNLRRRARAMNDWGQVLKIHFLLFVSPATLAIWRKMNFQDLTPALCGTESGHRFPGKPGT
jgi:hypothetical protein